jgi:hypothetical protein
VKRFCTVCSDYVEEPCSDPDCPIQDDADDCDYGRRIDDEEPRFYEEDFVYDEDESTTP